MNISDTKENLVLFERKYFFLPLTKMCKQFVLIFKLLSRSHYLRVIIKYFKLKAKNKFTQYFIHRLRVVVFPHYFLFTWDNIRSVMVMVFKQSSVVWLKFGSKETHRKFHLQNCVPIERNHCTKYCFANVTFSCSIFATKQLSDRSRSLFRFRIICIIYVKCIYLSFNILGIFCSDIS